MYTGFQLIITEGFNLLRMSRPDEHPMHMAWWLVKHTDQLFETFQPTSEFDKPIHYGLTLHEWRAIFLDVLAKDDDESAKQLIRLNYESIVELGDPIPAYPLLSHIKGLLWDSSFEPDEVQPLLEECVKLLESTDNVVARRGLEKLIRVCDEARRSGLGIVMLAD